MWDIGDCLSCSKISTCTETSLEKVVYSYSCPLFTPVVEPVFFARLEVMRKYGEIEAIKSMIRPMYSEDEVNAEN